MITPNYLEKLLDGVEVEWKPLGETVDTITAPAKVKKESYRETGEIPIIDQGIEFIAGYTDEDINPVKADEYVIFGDHSEHIKYVDFAFIQGADGLKILKPILGKAKYIYYAFKNFYKKEQNYKRHWSAAKETELPIPCPENPAKSLEIQAEIVRILDAFTELTAELTARKKQYEYYRDKLLTFEEGEVEWKSFGEIAKIQRGKRLIRNELEKFAEYAVYQNSLTPLGYYNKSNVKSDTSFIISAGAAGEIGYSDVDFWAADDVYFLVPHKSIRSKFIYYFLLSKKVKIYGQVRRASVPRLSKIVIEKLEIPVPPLAEQERIVAILDKFEALTSSITEGLPREIELRQKQYEYYRNMLLNFPKEA